MLEQYDWHANQLGQALGIMGGQVQNLVIWDRGQVADFTELQLVNLQAARVQIAIYCIMLGLLLGLFVRTCMGARFFLLYYMQIMLMGYCACQVIENLLQDSIYFGGVEPLQQQFLNFSGAQQLIIAFTKVFYYIAQFVFAWRYWMAAQQLELIADPDYKWMCGIPSFIFQVLNYMVILFWFPCSGAVAAQCFYRIVFTEPFMLDDRFLDVTLCQIQQSITPQWKIWVFRQRVTVGFVLNCINVALLMAALIRVGFFLSSQHDVQTNETFMTIHAYILLIAFVMSLPFMQDTDFGDQYEPGLVMATAALDFLVTFCMGLVMYAVAAGEGVSFGRTKEKSKNKVIHPEVNPNDFHADRNEMIKNVKQQYGIDNGSSVMKQPEDEENKEEVAPSPKAEFGMDQELAEKLVASQVVDDSPEGEEQEKKKLTDFYNDILDPLSKVDPFASTVIMQLSKKRALNTEDEHLEAEYTNDREMELLAKTREAEEKLRAMGIDPKAPNHKEKIEEMQKRTGSINSDDMHEDGNSLDGNGEGEEELEDDAFA